MSGTLRLRGSTSGYSELQAPAVAADQTFVLPTAGGTLLTTDSPVPKLTLELGSASQPSLTFQGDTDTGLFSEGTNTLNLVTGGSSKVVLGAAAHTIYAGTGATVRAIDIDSSGNVGIGTSSPDANLHIKGSYPTVHIQRDSATNYSRLLLDNTANDGGAIDGIGDGIGGLRFATSDAGTITERVRIDSSGNVGIGTSSPLASSGFTGVTVSGSTGGIYWFAKAGAQKGYLYGTDNDVTLASTDASGVIRLLTGGNNERMRVDSSGRLLVGTSSSPSAGDGQFGLLVVSGHTLGAACYASFQRKEPATSITNGETIAWLNFGDQAGNGFANIKCIADADAGSDDYPGRLVFSTTADGASSPTERMRIDNQGRLYVPDVYASTSGATANVIVESDGRIRRTTSSAKYKTQIETLEDSYADALLNCRPVWYRSTCEGDNPEHSWWGFIAEEVAEIDPRLVFWKTLEVTYDENGSVVTTPCDPEPEGVQYDRFVPHLLNLIKRQGEAIAELQAEVAALKAQ